MSRLSPISRRRMKILFVFTGILALTVLVQGQGKPDFLSIDCGLSESKNYTDPHTGLQYISDASFIDGGISMPISDSLKVNSLEQQFWNVRSFPEKRRRNCYTLSPPAGKNKTYLIRARFMYGNYDSKSQPPEFDLHLGVSYWDTVKLNDSSDIVSKEIVRVIHSDSINLCLVNKSGVPFISTIELRLLISDAYVNNASSLSLVNYFRYDFGSSDATIHRYDADNYDRLWYPYPNKPTWSTVNTSSPIDQDGYTSYLPGSYVMRTAITPANPNQTLNFSWQPTDPTAQFYFFMHFAETERLQSDEIRVFNVTINDIVWFKYLKPEYLYSTVVYSIRPLSKTEYNVALVKTFNSTLPPIWNAFEVYIARDILESKTDPDEVGAIMNIKSTYGIIKDWQGDPCYPEHYLWEGLDCNDDDDFSTITSLNLSSSGLQGKISSSISDLKSLKILDLSYNNISGTIPDFLAQMTYLEVINLNFNNLSGSIPQDLLKKNKSGSLQLSLYGNQNICLSSSCDGNKINGNNNSKNVIIIVVAVGASLLMLVLIATIVYLCLKKKVQETPIRSKFKTKNQPYTYGKILRMTNNLDTIIGEGGFGKVYLGTLDSGSKVAVKLLSMTSKQGYKEFEAEAQLLMVVHHKNLVSLIGYCDDIRNIALLYEYMPAGNLCEHLSDKNVNVLSWTQRIKIAVDAAQGLDYLHHGCKPPIIHRDLKSPNILLNENMQAKIADFGLSKAFETDNESYISTRPAGTPGYLDPEFQSSGNLCRKSDVYSFGIILFELITGHPAILRGPKGNTHILHWVTPLIQRGDVESIMDPRLKGQFSIHSAWKAVEIAMPCVSATAIQRPNINQVLQELNKCLDIEISSLGRS